MVKIGQDWSRLVNTLQYSSTLVNHSLPTITHHYPPLLTFASHRLPLPTIVVVAAHHLTHSGVLSLDKLRPDRDTCAYACACVPVPVYCLPVPVYCLSVPVLMPVAMPAPILVPIPTVPIPIPLPMLVHSPMPSLSALLCLLFPSLLFSFSLLLLLLLPRSIHPTGSTTSTLRTLSSTVLVRRPHGFGFPGSASVHALPTPSPLILILQLHLQQPSSSIFNRQPLTHMCSLNSVIFYCYFLFSLFSFLLQRCFMICKCPHLDTLLPGPLYFFFFLFFFAFPVRQLRERAACPTPPSPSGTDSIHRTATADSNFIQPDHLIHNLTPTTILSLSLPPHTTPLLCPLSPLHSSLATILPIMQEIPSSYSSSCLIFQHTVPHNQGPGKGSEQIHSPSVCEKGGRGPPCRGSRSDQGHWPTFKTSATLSQNPSYPNRSPGRHHWFWFVNPSCPGNGMEWVNGILRQGWRASFASFLSPFPQLQRHAPDKVGQVDKPLGRLTTDNLIC
jgi:hypothetical protein